MGQEIELKLALPPRAVAALGRHPLFAGAPAVGPRQTLINTYFDTPDLLLKGQRIALRTRRQGRHWLQTVKGGGDYAGGLSHRPEWEHPYHGQFDFSPVDAPALRALLEHQAPRLTPLFTTHFRRETRRHAPRPGVEILLMLDQGRVEAAGRHARLCELELELVQGGVADLFELAQALAADLPLAPEDLSKAQRGYQLFLDQPLQPMKALPSRIAATDEPLAAFRSLALDCVRQWQANANAAATSPDPELIHQIRVALRRLRSLLRLMAPCLPPGFVAEWAPRLAAEATRLGDARDLDVLLTTILAPVEGASTPPAGLPRLRQQAETHRQQAHRQARTALVQGLHGRAILAFMAALHALPPTPADGLPLDTLARQRLAQLARRARKRAKVARREPRPERLHALRIALKRMRYGMEFFLPLLPAKATERFLARLATAQDQLGYLNDLTQAQRHFQAWSGPRVELREAAGFVAGWHAPQVSHLSARLPRRIARLLKTLPY
ncbi:MAG: CHAD domain-containing protein [Rhodocyclaceae bacterium]|jgi:adenylate cyclase|nr:CHAD domain-containing protein [Rhodocyclaceae bacterium]